MKKFKTLSLLPVIIIISILLIGCVDSVLSDLENYIENQMPVITSTEEEVTNKFNSELNNKCSGDDSLLQTLNEIIIPESDKLIEAAKAVELQTDELKKVHEIYIDAMITQNQGFKKLAEAITDNSDKALAEEANAIFKKADDLSDTYVNMLHELANEHGYEFK